VKSECIPYNFIDCLPHKNSQIWNAVRIISITIRFCEITQEYDLFKIIRKNLINIYYSEY